MSDAPTPPFTAEEILNAVPGGPGYEARVTAAVAAALAEKDRERDEARRKAEEAEAETDIFQREAGEHLKTLDAVADMIGHPHDEELSSDHVRQFISALQSRATSAEALSAAAVDLLRRLIESAPSSRRERVYENEYGSVGVAEVSYPRFAQVAKEAIAFLSSPAPGNGEADWPSIETAPRDGTRILLETVAKPWDGAPEDLWRVAVDTGYWTDHNGGGWVSHQIGEPRRWHPLPAPPSTPSSPAAGSAEKEHG